MSLVTLYFTLHGAPWGAYAFRELAFQLARKHVSVALKEGVFNEIVPGLILYAERIRLEDGFMGRESSFTIITLPSCHWKYWRQEVGS
jgi:hypothetical protein